MDGDPLVPKETPPWKKAVLWIVVGAIAVFLVTALILVAIKGSTQGHGGNFLAALALGALSVTMVLMYRALPQDSVSGKVKALFYGQCFVFLLLAVGVLVMAYNTTECPKCPKCPDCPTECTLKGLVPGKWVQNPPCFEEIAKDFFITVSPTKTCPAPES